MSITSANALPLASLNLQNGAQSAITEGLPNGELAMPGEPLPDSFFSLLQGQKNEFQVLPIESLETVTDLSLQGGEGDQDEPLAGLYPMLAGELPVDDSQQSDWLALAVGAAPDDADGESDESARNAEARTRPDAEEVADGNTARANLLDDPAGIGATDQNRNDGFLDMPSEMSPGLYGAATDGEDLPRTWQAFSADRGRITAALSDPAATSASTRGAAPSAVVVGGELAESLAKKAGQDEPAADDLSARLPNQAEDKTKQTAQQEKAARIDYLLARQEVAQQQTAAASTHEGSNSRVDLASTVAPALQAVHLASAASSVNASQHSLQLASNATPSQWGQAIGEKVSLLINQKLDRAEIRIDPPHLGKLDIQIQLKDDVASIHIQTHQAATRDLVDAASFRLRDFLQESGYSAVDVNVSHQDPSQAQQQFHQQSADTGTGRQQGPEDSGNAAEVWSPQNVSLVGGRNVIDFFA